MSKKYFLLCSAAVLVAGTSMAQKLDERYITWPDGQQIASSISQWNGGAGTIKVNGVDWEDEEFFISRVKPRVRFNNRKAQVYTTITDETDKRCVFWVPIGDCLDGKFHSDALPNGVMDGEVFSMWNYIDHYGSWCSPFGWAPGAFADVAHKNGVAVSGVASVPFGSMGGWQSALANFGGMSPQADEVGKFFLYHGVDGIGYNSEWNGWAPTLLIQMHDKLKTYMADKNPLWEVMWYGGTMDNGQCGFDRGVGPNGGNSQLFNSASIFLNYNWNSGSTMQNSINYAKSVDRNPFFIYAGMNQQGGEPRSGVNYPLLKDYQYSIGLWGAHNVNMLWQSRNAKGSTHEAMSRTYLNDCEMWFSNGPRNPAIRKEITTNRSHRPNAEWAGLSSMMSARSSINHDIAAEPFYSFFNLGNGKFFNWKGQRLNDNPWYNIGVQDFLPTWRWWFAPAFMDGDITADEVHLAADFTWDDAYVGGSCLQITGTSDEEYLHLFKTNIVVKSGNKIVVRYKLLEGSAGVSLLLANGNNPTEVARGCEKEILKADDAAAVLDASYDTSAQNNYGWQTAEISVNSSMATQLRTSNGNLGVIALKFTNAKNMKLLLGEVGIYKDGGYNASVATPEVKSSKVVNNSYTGVDGKIIWKMPNNKAVGEPVYNSDVNTSMFKVYSREGADGEPQFLGVTTSWAAIAFRAPNTDDSKQIQFGVSAVSLDTENESPIAWGELQNKGTYTPSDEIVISKTTIKANEAFSISYVDDRHSESTWKLTDTKGDEVASGNGLGLDVPAGLPEVGGYNLYIDEGTANERVFGYYVQISDEAVGAVPEIYSIAYNGQDTDPSMELAEIKLQDTPSLSYTGRYADGSASRSLALNGRMIGAKVGDLGIEAQKSLSIAGWFKFNEFPDDSWAFMNVSNLGGSWPQCNWGWCWNSVDANGQISCVFRGAASDSSSPGELHYEFPNTKLQAEIWTHIAFVCEYNDAASAFRLSLYINGIKQESEWLQYNTWNNGAIIHRGTTDDFVSGQTYGIASTDYVYFGGPLYQHSAVEGVVDDFQVWGKAMTQEDVNASMAGFTADNLPTDIIALWDFENDAAADFSFPAIGSMAGAKAFSHTWNKVGETDPHATCIYYEPSFASGCPFLTGTAFPVVTTAEWKDAADRKTAFTKATTTNEGERGSATVKFNKSGDHNVALTLKNSYGESVAEFPVISVETSAIEGIAADDAALSTYTIDNVLFVEFAADGQYTVEVFNAAGVMVGNETLNAVAGQNARITLGAAGVYVVRVSCGGQVVRTVKVISK